MLDDEENLPRTSGRPANDAAPNLDASEGFEEPIVNAELSGYVVEMAASLVYLAIKAGDEELARRLAYALRGRRTPDS